MAEKPAPVDALEEHWNQFREKVIPKDMNEEQLHNAKLTFYAGMMAGASLADAAVNDLISRLFAVLPSLAPDTSKENQA